MSIKKYVGIVLFIMISFFAFSYNTKANYSAKYVATGKCKLKAGSTGDCFYENTKFDKVVPGTYWLDTGDNITVITSVAPVPAPKTGNGSECKTTFSYVSIVYNSKTYKGYACTSNISTGNVSDSLKKEFQVAGFPESYWPSLAILKQSHPKWNFVAINTGLDFKTAVNNEDSGNRSLIYSNSAATQGYLSTKEGNYDYTTDKFKVYDGTHFYAANNATIAYYMDPRNFLSDMYIFQFESLSYSSQYQTLSSVKDLLGNAYIAKFAQHFITAAQKTGVNPIYLASLAKQEVGAGTTANTAISGKAFTYNKKTYSGLYNFFNIGATSGSDNAAAYRGLIWANGGEDGSQKTYNRPWTSEEKAIVGGAMFINDGYISVGQDTSYFKKWDIQYNNHKTGTKDTTLYTHQYQQNIEAPTSEAQTTYYTYNKLGTINSAFTFYIPVYLNMPATESKLPKTGNPNNYLKTLTYNTGSGAKTVTGFTGSKTSYSFNVANNVSSVTLAATAVNSTYAKISGVGAKTLKVGDNKFSITVTAGNGSTRTYTVTINRAAATTSNATSSKTAEQIVKEAGINIDSSYVTGLTFTTSISTMKSKINKVSPEASLTVKRNNKAISSGNLVTGDVLTITNGSSSKNYTVVLYGDINGDGKVSAMDLLKVQKHILNFNKLTGASLKAADASKDGKVSAMDLLKVQKHILNVSIIKQN